jgi:3-deoxy-7-phosphoheptulonate synthase
MSSAYQDDRKMIDSIDNKLVALISERIRTAKKIGAAKGSDCKANLWDIEREREVFSKWARIADEEGLSSYYVGRILREVLNYSRRVQEGFLENGQSKVARPVTRVGYQGVQNSYSYLALSKLFSCRNSTCLKPIGFRSFAAVVDALSADVIDYAFLPIENTIAGSLNDVYMLLREQQTSIVDEEIWHVEHCLAGLPGANLDQIQTIRSHSVALQQCQSFLAKITWASAEVYYDTAAAAESVIAQGDPRVTAICSKECALEMGLKILQQDIADQHHNYTRFVLVTSKPEKVDKRLPCKTSLQFTVCHRGGALSEVLQAFARRQINLSKLESRPQPDSPWEYLFYIDADGHQDDPEVADALTEIREYTNYLGILGSYPRRSHELDEIPSRHTQLDESVQAEHIVISPRSKVDHDVKQLTNSEAVIDNVQLQSKINIGNVEIGGSQFVVIAGPCAVESRQQIFDAATMVKDRGARILRGGAFKPRTSPHSFQGLGFPGVEMLVEAGRNHELPVVTEVLRTEDVDRVANHVDAIQVGARNMQNFALLKKLGTINRTVVLKRGMSATIDELLKAAEYITSGGNQRVVLCERGIRTFESATRSTLDISAVVVLRERTNLPIIVDPSHAAGRRELVIPLALAAAAAGANGLLVEAHPYPEKALCDGRQSLTADDLNQLMTRLEQIVNMNGHTLS